MFSENTKNVRYRIKGIFFFLCILFLFASCEPVNRTDLTSPPVDSNAKTAAAISKANDPKSLVVSFSLVENADSYQVYASEAKGSDGTKLGLEAIEPVSVSSSDFSGGKYRATLSGFVPGGSYDIFVQAKNNANSDWVTVWKDKYTVAAASPSSAEAPTYKIEPNNSKTSLSVYVNSTVGYKYLVTLTENTPATASARAAGSNVIRSEIKKGNGNEIEFSFGTKENSSYAMSISYAYITASDESLINNVSSSTAESTAEVDMSSFYDISITYDDETGEFTASDLPEGTKSVMISDYDGDISSASVAVSGSEPVKIDSSEFIKGLEHGYFYAYATTDEGKTYTSISNVWCFRNPIYTEDDVKAAANWQTFNLDWDISSSIEATYSVNVKKSAEDTSTVPEDPSRNIEATVNASGISVTGLSSRTKYTAEVKIKTSDNESCVFTIPFETKSFAGTYKWSAGSAGNNSGKCVDFIVDVTDAPAESAYQYYVYVNKDDSYNKEHKDKFYRMLPLIDSKETITEKIDFKNPGKYESENTSYQWNYEKWSTMSATINFWYPCAMEKSGSSYVQKTGKENLNYRDYVLTNVTTNASALFMKTDANTNTSWTFRETNGKPEIIFRNEGEGLASIGMFKNPAPQAGLDEWSFLLSYAGEVN